MTDIPGKGSPRLARGPAGHTTQRSKDGAAPKQGGVQAMLIKVQCPNPACGKTYTVKNGSAGKKGECPDCEAVISVPNVPASRAGGRTSPGQRREEGGSRPAGVAGAARREQVTPREGPGVREVRTGCIGRGNAGKTALLLALGEGTVG